MLREEAQHSVGKGEEARAGPGAQLQPQTGTCYPAKPKPDPCPALLSEDESVGVLSPFLWLQGLIKG